MSVDRSLRSTFAAILLVAALFIAMNRVVASAPVADWFLPLVLFILGAALVPNWNFSRGASAADEEEEALALPGADVHTFRVSAQQVPRLQTMTIRPDPESSEYTVVTVSEDTPTITGDVLPFIETEIIANTTVTSAPAATPAPPAPVAEAPAAPPAPIAEPAPTEAPAAPTTATAPAPSTEGGMDDLTKLNGIGPKSAAALTAAGIDTYQKLASASEEQIRAAVAGVRLVGDVTSWASQAAYAARGDWAGLDQLKAALRKPSSGD